MTTRDRHIRQFLTGSRGPFEGAPAPVLDELARHCTLREFAGGETVALRGSEVAGAWGIHSGHLKAFVTHADGGCFLADVVGPGEWFGLVPALRRAGRDFDLRAVGATRLVMVERVGLEACLQRHPLAHRGVALLVSRRLELALEMLQAHSFLGAEGRLALRLLRVLDRHGCTAPDGGLTLPFRLSQEELGQMVGISREAVGRFLRAWEREGLVDLAYAQLVVRRREALEQRSLGPRTPAPSRAPGAKTSRS